MFVMLTLELECEKQNKGTFVLKIWSSDKRDELKDAKPQKTKQSPNTFITRDYKHLQMEGIIVKCFGILVGRRVEISEKCNLTL